MIKRLGIDYKVNIPLILSPDKDILIYALGSGSAAGDLLRRCFSKRGIVYSYN